MISVPVLALPNFSKQFVVETDTSGQVLGAVLMQDSHPIAFFCRVLSQSVKQKSVYKRKLMAVVFAVQKQTFSGSNGSVESEIFIRTTLSERRSLEVAHQTNGIPH